MTGWLPQCNLTGTICLSPSGWLVTLSDFVSLFLSYYPGLNGGEQSDQLPDCSNVEMCAVLWVTATVSHEIKGQGSKEGGSQLPVVSTFLML